MSNSITFKQKSGKVPVVHENAMVAGSFKRKHRSQTGFTLIELILVLVIAGFIISLVAPAITSTTGLNLRTAAKRVAAGLRYARSQAVTTGSVYRIVFDIEENEMIIERIVEEDPYALQTGEAGGGRRGSDEEEARSAGA